MIRVETHLRRSWEKGNLVSDFFTDTECDGAAGGDAW